MQRLAPIQAGLLGTLVADTRAALVQHASTSQERYLLTNSGQLTANAEQAGIGSPAIWIVGDVLKEVAASCDANRSSCLRPSRCLLG